MKYFSWTMRRFFLGNDDLTIGTSHAQRLPDTFEEPFVIMEDHCGDPLLPGGGPQQDLTLLGIQEKRGQGVIGRGALGRPATATICRRRTCRPATLLRWSRILDSLEMVAD